MRFRLILLGLCSALSVIAPAASAQAASAGSLDPSFADGAIATADIGASGGAHSVVGQPDGKVVLAGEATRDGRKDFAVMRYRSDGSLDTSFGDGGSTLLRIGDGSSANSVRLAPDGKLLISGTAMFGTTLKFAVARLLANGRPDPAFGSDGVVTEPIGYAAIAMVALPGPDGSVLVGGTARTLATGPTKISKLSMVVLRLDESGVPDPSFGDDGLAIAPGPAGNMGLLVDADGRPALFGVTEVDGIAAFAAARFTRQGLPDERFAGDGSVAVPVLEAGSATGAVLEPDGSIVLAGPGWNGRRKVLAAARVSPTGDLDRSFGNDGIAAIEVGGITANGAMRQADGRIVVASTGGMTAVRFNPDGSIDSTFGDNGIAAYASGDSAAANGVAIDSNGNILLGGAVRADGRLYFAGVRLIGDQGQTSAPVPSEQRPPVAQQEPAPAPAPVPQPPRPPATAGPPEFENDPSAGASSVTDPAGEAKRTKRGKPKRGNRRKRCKSTGGRRAGRAKSAARRKSRVCKRSKGSQRSKLRTRSSRTAG